MTEDDEYEARIADLLARESILKLWLDQMRSFAKDANGRTVILGLTAEETEEFIRLNPVVHADDDDHPHDAAYKAARERYYALREKHDIARSKDAAENLAFWSDKKVKH